MIMIRRTSPFAPPPSQCLTHALHHEEDDHDPLLADGRTPLESPADVCIPCSSPSPYEARIAFFNCRGIDASEHDIRLLMQNYNIPVIFLSETFATSSRETSLPGDPFTFLSLQDAYKVGGARSLRRGLGALINSDHPSSPAVVPLHSDNYVSWCQVVLYGTSFTVASVYFPPSLPSPQLEKLYASLRRDALTFAPSGRFIIGGDFNARCSGEAPERDEAGEFLHEFASGYSPPIVIANSSLCPPGQHSLSTWQRDSQEQRRFSQHNSVND